jgi:hypothetical protein
MLFYTAQNIEFNRFAVVRIREPESPSLYLFSVSETTGGRDSALRCPRAVQSRNGWGKIDRSLVPPLDAAGTAQRAVPTTVNTYRGFALPIRGLRPPAGRK